MVQMRAMFESQSEREDYEGLRKEDGRIEKWEILNCLVMKELFKKVSESSFNLFPDGVEMNNQVIGWSLEWFT